MTRFVLRSLLYIVLMNTFMFILCVIFDTDFDPTLISGVVVPVACAQASLWAEGKRRAKRNGSH